MKAILVTGANSGIGYYITRRLAANGFHVYAGIRNSDNLHAFDDTNNVQVIKLDITIQHDIDDAVAFIESQDYGLYGIVNNAGVTTFANMDDMPESEMQRIFDTNVMGPYRINKALSSKLVASSGRSIIIGSISGFRAFSGNGAYVMSKFAMEGYADVYAQEMAELGVHVSIIEPGGYKSNLVRRELDNELLQENIREKLIDRLQHYNRIKQDPHDVAAAVLEVMVSETPKRRYMVTTTKSQAEKTIDAAMSRVVELNHDQAHELSRDELVKMLDLLLAEFSSE
jgi:NAD(P)-dependent dehydrogenase (short-subunit alcohol dehydrogenase family)